MNAKLNNKTVMRIQQIINQPISRGIDKAINLCLDILEAQKIKPKRSEKH